jgi:hypothetical protein
MLRGAVKGRAIPGGPNFARLIGVYVALCFLMAQFLNKIRFGHAPTLLIDAGGARIVAGGLPIAFWKA